MPILSNISLIPSGTNAPSAIVYEIFTGTPGISSLAPSQHQERTLNSGKHKGSTCIGSCRQPIAKVVQPASRGLACRLQTLTWTYTLINISTSIAHAKKPTGTYHL